MKINTLLNAPLIIAKLSICITLLCFVSPISSEAQTTCSSVVSFSVEKEKSEPIEVYFGELKAQGPDEASAKSQLESEVLKTKNRAIENCKSKYENTAGCLQAKIVSSASALQSASFGARKALEDALLSDCKKQQGLCKNAKASEIKCVIAEPTAAPDPKAAGAKGAEAKKEEKKK